MAVCRTVLCCQKQLSMHRGLSASHTFSSVAGKIAAIATRVTPTKDEMTRVTAALITQIAEISEAPVYLLHFRGMKNNPIFGLVSGSVRRISALAEDFDYVIQDNVMSG